LTGTEIGQLLLCGLFCAITAPTTNLETTEIIFLQVPSPAAGAPAHSRAERTPPIDPILAAAHYFHGLGVVTVTHDLQEKLQKNGKVCKAPSHWASPKSWKEANLSNCLSEFAKPGRNSIAIVIEVSDNLIYALDVDMKDGGFEALEQMLEEHGGFLEDTPRLTTGNGGLHILFSLSQSEQAGLRNCCNRARIRYKGQTVGIDVRGKGRMLYTAPSTYATLDGTLRRYEWDQEILPDRSNLRAVPEWLVSILNNSGEASSGGVEVPREGDKAGYVLGCLSASYATKPAVVVLAPPGSSSAYPSCSKLSKLSKLWHEFFLGTMC
jgi:hypothetical protein